MAWRDLEHAENDWHHFPFRVNGLFRAMPIRARNSGNIFLAKLTASAPKAVGLRQAKSLPQA